MLKLIYRATLICLALIGTVYIAPMPSTESDVVIEMCVPTTMETITTEPTEAPEEVTLPEFIPKPTKFAELETEPTETEFVSYYSYTEGELDLLARLVYSEASGESYDTKLKIASVVMNRVEDPYFPNTIREVIYQRGQFAVTFEKIDGVIMINRPADEESYRAAKEVLDYGSVLPSTVQVFYAKYCTGSWVRSRAVYEVCDNTVFAHIYGG